MKETGVHNDGTLTGIASMATRHILAELVDSYERRAGQRVAIESTGGVEAVRRLRAGERFDIVVLAADAIDALGAANLVDLNTRTDVANSGIAIAVKAGATRPDFSDEKAVRDAVLSAPSIGYSTGPSGAHIAQLFERWDIIDTIKKRIVQAPPGVPVGTLIESGEVALGFQQLSELMDLPGVDVIGPLPPEIQSVTTFSAAVGNASRRSEAARDFIAFLASPEADAAKRRHGMAPATTVLPSTT